MASNKNRIRKWFSICLRKSEAEAKALAEAEEQASLAVGKGEAEAMSKMATTSKTATTSKMATMSKTATTSKTAMATKTAKNQKMVIHAFRTNCYSTLLKAGPLDIGEETIFDELAENMNTDQEAIGKALFKKQGSSSIVLLGVTTVLKTPVKNLVKSPVKNLVKTLHKMSVKAHPRRGMSVKVTSVRATLVKMLHKTSMVEMT